MANCEKMDEYKFGEFLRPEIKRFIESGGEESESDEEILDLAEVDVVWTKKSSQPHKKPKQSQDLLWENSLMDVDVVWNVKHVSREKPCKKLDISDEPSDSEDDTSPGDIVTPKRQTVSDHNLEKERDNPRCEPPDPNTEQDGPKEEQKPSEMDPDPNMDPSELIGKQIKVWWPRMHQWHNGVVTSQQGRTHVVRYRERPDKTSKDEEYLEKLLNVKNPARWKLLL